MKTQYQVKDVSMAVKDVDTVQGIVTGYFSIFNNKDSDGDIIIPGAFKKTIQENGPATRAGGRILHLYQHDPTKVLSKPKLLQEDDKGLYFESAISHTALGKDVIQLYFDGVLTEHSIGFQTIKSEESRDGNKLIELKLWEGSTVAWGANMEALMTSFKAEGFPETIYDTLIKKLEALNAAVKGNYTDDTARQLEIQLKQLQQIIQSLAEKAEPVNTPPIEKPTIAEAIQIIKSNIKSL